MFRAYSIFVFRNSDLFITWSFALREKHQLYGLETCWSLLIINSPISIKIAHDISLDPSPQFRKSHHIEIPMVINFEVISRKSWISIIISTLLNSEYFIQIFEICLCLRLPLISKLKYKNFMVKGVKIWVEPRVKPSWKLIILVYIENW